MKIKYTPLFIRSAKKYNRKHYPMDEVKKCVTAIVTNDQKFLKKHKDHPLNKGVREMHIDRQYNDDWLLYYRFNEYTEQIELILLDIGNHKQTHRIIFLLCRSLINFFNIIFCSFKHPHLIMDSKILFSFSMRHPFIAFDFFFLRNYFLSCNIFG